MNLPDLRIGERKVADIRIAPDIPEQLELSRRIGNFLFTAQAFGIAPTQSDRKYGDIRLHQPEGFAILEFSRSTDLRGKEAVELHVDHLPRKLQSHYAYSGNYWQYLHASRRRRGSKPHVDTLSHEEMLEEILEYDEKDKFDHLKALQDTAVEGDALIEALDNDLAPRAHKKQVLDSYTANVLTVQDGGYAFNRRVELGEKRRGLGHVAERMLAVSAFISYSDDTILEEIVRYHTRFDNLGRIAEDRVSLTLASTDGFSEKRLKHLALGSDLADTSIDRLNAAMDDLDSRFLTDAA